MRDSSPPRRSADESPPFVFELPKAGSQFDPRGIYDVPRLLYSALSNAHYIKAMQTLTFGETHARALEFL